MIALAIALAMVVVHVGLLVWLAQSESWAVFAVVAMLIVRSEIQGAWILRGATERKQMASCIAHLAKATADSMDRLEQTITPRRSEIGPDLLDRLTAGKRAD